MYILSSPHTSQPPKLTPLLICLPRTCVCVCMCVAGTPQSSVVSESGSRENEAKTLRNVLRTENELQNLTVRWVAIRVQGEPFCL